MRKILVFNGNPKGSSFCQALAESYAQGARAAGHQVTMRHLHGLHFSPDMPAEHPEELALEPDLQAFQQDLLWCDHLFVIYPTWWAGMPAQLKGLWDRSMQAGFAFRYRKDSPLWDKLLQGRSATVVTTMDTPALVDLFYMRRAGLRQLAQGILAFCGFKIKQQLTIGSVRKLGPAQRQSWIAKLGKMGRQL